MTQFYTYMWLREDGTPYYIGKGSGRRAYRWHKAHGCVLPDRVVIYPAESEAEAFEAEIALIWYYGRKDLGTGCLRNLTNGGENPPKCTPESYRKRVETIIKNGGFKHSDESKSKISATHKNKVVKESTKEKLREVWDKRKNSGVEIKVGSDKPFLGRKHTEEAKRIVSDKKKLWWAERKAKGASACL